MKKTKMEILDETVKYYSTHPRALEGQMCIYLSDEGNKCAFGRCMTASALSEFGKYNGTIQFCFSYS